MVSVSQHSTSADTFDAAAICNVTSAVKVMKVRLAYTSKGHTNNSANKLGVNPNNDRSYKNLTSRAD